MFKQIKTFFNLLTATQKLVFLYGILVVFLTITLFVLNNLYTQSKKSYRVLAINKSNYEYVIKKAYQLNDILDVNHIISKFSNYKDAITTRSQKYSVNDLSVVVKENVLVIDFSIINIEENILFLNDILTITKLQLSMLKVIQDKDFYKIQLMLN